MQDYDIDRFLHATHIQSPPNMTTVPDGQDETHKRHERNERGQTKKGDMDDTDEK